jgi:hypothetical protein
MFIDIDINTAAGILRERDVFAMELQLLAAALRLPVTSLKPMLSCNPTVKPVTLNWKLETGNWKLGTPWRQQAAALHIKI